MLLRAGRPRGGGEGLRPERHPHRARVGLPAALREALAAGETMLIDAVTYPGAFTPITFFDGTLQKVRAAREDKA
jgi:hypothetical protein